MLIGLNVQLQAPIVLAEQSNPTSVPKGQSLQPWRARNCRVNAGFKIALFSHPVDRDSIRKIPATWRKRGIHGFEITFHALSRLKGVPCPIPAKNTGPFLRPTPDQHRSGCLGSQNEMKFGHRVGSRTFHEQKPGRESSGKPVPISLRERSCMTKPPQRLMPGGQTAPAPES